jgi:serine/threonine kinase 32
MQDRQAAAAVAGKVPEDDFDAVTSTKSQARSQPTSPDGSPPLSPTAINIRNEENFPPMEELRAALPQQSQQQQHTQAQQGVARPVSASKSFSRPIPPQRPQAAARQLSKGGGVQMVLGEEGSWSNLADQTTTLPADAVGEGSGRAEKGGSMLGFLSRKKGRDRSPKPKEPGVLGKMGARHIIN